MRHSPTETDLKIAEKIRDLAVQIPLTNSTAVRLALNLPVPTGMGGDCIHQALKVAASLEEVPGEIRFHRAIDPSDATKKGVKGAHAAAFKNTQDGLRLIDLSQLHAEPLVIPEVESLEPSLLGTEEDRQSIKLERHPGSLLTVQNLPIKGLTIAKKQTFCFAPECAAEISELDTARVTGGGSFSTVDYFARFFKDGRFGQVTYHTARSAVTWDQVSWENGVGQISREFLHRPQDAEARALADKWLKHWSLDLGVVIPFLSETYLLQEEVNDQVLV